MACFGPLTAYHPKDGGKVVETPFGTEVKSRRLVFDPRKAHSGIAVKIPCGRCVGCRLERSRQWAMRCMHEKRMHNMSSFLTLTYNDEYLPVGNTLVLRDLQLFMKRLRKVTGNGLRFYACGEYGDLYRRPHYHVLLFNYDFDDRERLFGVTGKGGTPLYRSKTAEALWSDGEASIGYVTIGDVTFDSCAYVARYIMKKQIGKESVDFARYCPVTGVVALPEFTVMSRRPGLGTDYYVRFGSEVHVHDSVVVNSREVRPPRFYDTKCQLMGHMDKVKLARRRAVDRKDNTPSRLRVKEQVAEAALKLKGRVL